MKKYIKPTIQIVELRPEERIASPQCKWQGDQGGLNCWKFTGSNRS